MSRILYEEWTTLKSAESKRDAYLLMIFSAAYALGLSAALTLKIFAGTSSAPLEPQNIVLIVALLTARPDRQWFCLLACFAAHVMVTHAFGGEIFHAIITFTPNAFLGLCSARAIQHLSAGPPLFTDLPKAQLFIFTVGFIVPAIAALVSADIHIPPQLSARLFFNNWFSSFTANSLTSLAFLPLTLILMRKDHLERRKIYTHAFKIVSLVLGLTFLCAVASSEVARAESKLLPLLVCLPAFLILWITACFGIKGAAVAIAALTLIVTPQMSGMSFPAGGSSAGGIIALQVLLIGIAIPSLLLGVYVDRSQQTANLAQDNEDRMAFAVSAANLVLWQFTPKDNQFWCADRCAELFGIEAKTAVSVDKLLDAVHPGDRASVERLIKYAPHIEQDRGIEFRVCLPAGGIRWLLIGSYERAGKDNHPQTINGIFSDVTLRKRAEEKIETQRLQLAHGMRVAQVSALSTGLAHELTQPLTSILANSQAAQAILRSRRPNLPEIASILDDIIEANGRAASVIAHLRSLLRKGSGDFESVDLNQLVNSTVALIRSEIAAHHISIEKDLDESLPPVMGDPTQLQQVLLNFLTNAIEALHGLPKERKKIAISTRYGEDKSVEFTVTDMGIGMTDKAEAQVFDPFFTTKPNGLGLGLAICSKIIERHRGELGVRQNSGCGATAWFRLTCVARED